MNSKKSLKHVGVLGMKWGHRKGSSASSGGGSRSKKTSSSIQTGTAVSKAKNFLNNPALKKSAKAVGIRTAQKGARLALLAAKIYVGYKVASAVVNLGIYVAWRISLRKYMAAG